jgi:hypothetical protein
MLTEPTLLEEDIHDFLIEHADALAAKLGLDPDDHITIWQMVKKNGIAWAEQQLGIGAT